MIEGIVTVLSLPGIHSDLPSLPLQPSQAHDVTATFVGIVRTVVYTSTIKLSTYINMGSKLGGSRLPPHGIGPSRLGYGDRSSS